MIRLSNGHSFSYLAASGALAYDGKGWPWEQPLRWTGFLDPRLFTVITKTLTYAPRRGYFRWYAPWRTVRLLKDGTVNAIGLTNPGFRWWCGRIGATADHKKIPLIVSIRSENLDELSEMATELSRFDIVGFELNVSCPNSKIERMADPAFVKSACHAIKNAAPNTPLALKLAVVPTLAEIVKVAEEFVEFFDINSVPWSDIFSNRESPLKRYGGGGVSGKAAQAHTWRLYEQISSLTTRPVVVPSMWTLDDVRTMESRGAPGFSFGSVFLRYPAWPTDIVRRHMARKERP